MPGISPPVAGRQHIPPPLAIAGPTSDEELSVLFQRVGAVVLVLGSALVEATLFLRDISNDQCQRNGIVVSFLDH